MKKKSRRQNRLPYGSGSVSGPYANGTWEVRISIGHDADGNRLRIKKRVRAVDKAAAVMAISDLRKVHDADCDARKRPVLKDYLESWIHRKEESLSEKTITNYRCCADHIIPIIGHVRIDLLEHEHVTLLLDRLRGSGCGDRTIQACYDALRACLYFAVKTDRILKGTPTIAVPRPSHHYELGYYNREEAERFLDAVATDRLRALFHLVVAVALRRGEVLGLKWQDVDFESATLSIRRALAESGLMKSTKTKRSQRLIALPSRTVKELRAHRERLVSEGLATCPLVFPLRNGLPLDPRTLYAHFIPAMQRAGLRRIRFHDLRHTAATIRLAAGDHPNVVQEMLGHTKVETTLGVYGHVMPTMQRDSAALYDRLMPGTDCIIQDEQILQTTSSKGGTK